MAETYKPKRWELPTETTSTVQTIKAEPIPSTPNTEPVLKVDVVSSATGSAYYERDCTKVLCAVYGPKPSTQTQFNEQGILNCEVKFAPFALQQRPKRFAKSQAIELQMAATLTQALSTAVQLFKFPKHEIFITVEILETGGDELAAAITCASLALTDSAIDMYDMVGATSAAFLSKAGVVLHPTEEHVSHPKCRGTLTLAYMPKLQQITYMEQLGYVKPDNVRFVRVHMSSDCIYISTFTCFHISSCSHLVLLFTIIFPRWRLFSPTHSRTVHTSLHL